MRTYLEKYIKIREKNLKYDFLPSLLKIIERPENPMANIIIVLISSLLVATVIWAACCKIDISVTAYGSLNAEGNIVAVNNEYSGTIIEICVEEGDYVEKGEVLLTLDSQVEERLAGELKEELQILEIQKEMYSKIMEQEDLSEFDTGIYGEHAPIAVAICKEQELFFLQKRQFDIVKESAENRKLLDNQRENFITEHELTILQTINRIDETISEKELELEKVIRIIEGKKVTAPTSGVISNWRINTEGYYLSVGQNISYIIPDNAETVFTAYVKSADIEAIEVGEEVKVKIAALNNSEYERVTGKIQRIGNLTITMDGIGNVYPVEIVLSDIPQDMLHIGSEGTCFMIAGQRSVLDYFLEPFRNNVENALHER